jgi:hypothetical protein
MLAFTKNPVAASYISPLHLSQFNHNKRLNNKQRTPCCQKVLEGLSQSYHLHQLITN